MKTFHIAPLSLNLARGIRFLSFSKIFFAPLLLPSRIYDPLRIWLNQYSPSFQLKTRRALSETAFRLLIDLKGQWNKSERRKLRKLLTTTLQNLLLLGSLTIRWWPLTRRHPSLVTLRHSCELNLQSHILPLILSASVPIVLFQISDLLFTQFFF